MPVFNNVLAGAAGAGGGDPYEIKRSLRFNSTDDTSLSKNFGTASNRKKWTYSTWVKRSKLGSEQIFGIERQQGNGQGYEYIRFNSNDRIDLYLTHNGSNWSGKLETAQRFRDVSAWMHVVLVCDIENSTTGDRIRLYVNGKRVTEFNSSAYPATTEQTTINSTGTHNIGRLSANSNHFNGYLTEIHFLDGLVPSTSTDDANGSVTGTPNAEYLTTFGKFNSGVWDPIEYKGSHGSNGFYLNFSDNSTNNALGTDSSGNNNTWSVNNIGANDSGYTTAVVGPWTSGWSGSQLGSYSPGNMFNGSTGSLTAFGSGGGTWSKSTGNGIPATSSVQLFYILRSGSGSISVNGTSLGLSEGWQTLNLSYPTEVTSIVMSQNSGNGPDIRAMKVDGKFVIDNANAGSYSYETPDSVIDSPTNYEAESGNNGGNYPTLNPLHLGLSHNGGVNPQANLKYGNLKSDGNGAWAAAISTVPVPTSGKWYVEFVCLGDNTNIGLFKPVYHLDGTIRDSPTGGSKAAWYGFNGTVYYYNNGYNTSSSAPDTYNVGDLIALAIDSDNNTVKYYKNNSLQYTQTLHQTLQNELAAGNLFPGVDTYGGVDCIVNFGASPFKYTPPSGYKSICTANLPAGSITEPSKYFDALKYNGSNTTSQSSLDFEPDFVWTKSRSNNDTHFLWDQVRGAEKYLISAGTNTENTNTGLTSFDSNGFSYGSWGPLKNGSMSAWCWDAGTAFSNSAGTNFATIASSGRANNTSGFSITTYTGNGNSSGAKVYHGLNQKPDALIIKSRDTTYSWIVWHKEFSSTELIYLNHTYEKQTGKADHFNSTLPEAGVFSLRESPAVNANNVDYVCYAMHGVEGFSKFGTYRGNGLTNGVFVHTGFKPAFIMGKRFDSNGGSDNWFINDDVGDGYNAFNYRLYPNLNNQAASGTDINMDILSNGFKLRSTNTNSNGAGADYIYFAFAANPFKTARAI